MAMPGGNVFSISAYLPLMASEPLNFPRGQQHNYTDYPFAATVAVTAPWR
jgi:hypothetical protein